MIARKKVLSLNISIQTYQSALNAIINLAQTKKPAYVCFANVHMVIEAHQNKAFSENVNSANLVCADGMPLVKTIEFFYGIKTDRVAGMDVFPELLKLAEQNELQIFLFGTTDDLLKKITDKAKLQFPKLNIVGAYSPPFDKDINDEVYVEMINKSGANLVFVALGCPKQEMWMARHSHKINAVLLGVGGAFPIYADTAKRAPRWMRNTGLEWLYRLWQEPRRLFKRYFKTNTLFIYLIIKQKFKIIFSKNKEL